MKHLNLHLFTTVLILGYAALSSASDNSATVFPAEGNKQCSDYATNSILQMNTTSPVAAGSLTGPDTPQDINTTGESAAYTVSGGKVLGFSAATTFIDYAVLKSSSKVSVIIYPSGGVKADANMRLTVAGVDQTISSISLCYGLGNAAALPPPPPPLKTLKSCGTSSSLDDTTVSCGGMARNLICNFELDKPFYGLKDGTDSCCVCNSAALSECDPNVPAGGLNACTSTSAKALPTEVTTHIELNNDPYVCTTAGSGPRICYRY